MKKATSSFLFLKHPARLLLLTLSLTVLFSNRGFSQIDYYYGKNYKGFRIMAGGGFNVLENKFQVNPVKESFTASLEYNFNRFFSMGVEGQSGTLTAQNKFYPGGGQPHQPFSPITNKYNTANFNMKFSYGLLKDFETSNDIVDALKDIYVGVGIGVIQSNTTLIPAYQPTPPEIILKPKDVTYVVPFNIGINIDLPQIKGKDVFAVNTNFQINMVGDKYLEGFSSSFTKVPVSFYNLFSVSLKYKF